MELRKISFEDVWEITELAVEDSQTSFVTANTISLIEAFVTRENGGVALPFGLYEGGALVGFVMIGYGTTGDGDEPAVAKGNYCLWRLMIDKKYQGRGLGHKAVEAALEYIKSQSCGEAEYCWVSYEEENIAARRLYESFGFCENSERSDGERVAVLKLI